MQLLYQAAVSLNDLLTAGADFHTQDLARFLRVHVDAAGPRGISPFIGVTVFAPCVALGSI